MICVHIQDGRIRNLDLFGFGWKNYAVNNSPFYLNTGKGSKKPAYKKAVETGTANDDVDYEWIPRSALRTPGNLISKAMNRTKV